MRPQLRGIPYNRLACFLLDYHRTFTGRRRAVRALRLDDRGPFACWERKQDGAHLGAVVIFDLLIRDLAPGGLRNRGNPG